MCSRIFRGGIGTVFSNNEEQKNHSVTSILSFLNKSILMIFLLTRGTIFIKILPDDISLEWNQN